LTTLEVIERLRDGRLPTDAEACGNPREGFRPLDEHPPFASLLRAAAKASRQARAKPEADSEPGSWRVVYITGITALLLAVLALVYLFFLRGS
jgi:hypothetical protein